MRHLKSKKPLRKTISVILSLMIVVSALVFVIPMASAKGESAFMSNEEIFIDMRDFSGWDDKADFRVFTFYNNSDDENYCHEYAGNFNNDGWYEGSNVLQAGIKADKFCDHVYRFRIPTTDVSHLRIVRTDSGSNTKWNLSAMMWDNNRNKNAGEKSNCVKITGWDNSSTWSMFRPKNNAASYVKTARPDSSITGDDSLYKIGATFYDYYNDDEIQNGWLNIHSKTNHASVHWTQNYSSNSWYWWAGYWEPFQYLNSKIAAHDSGVNYPLYFGNFNGKWNDYTGEGSSNLRAFDYHANNSAGLSDYHVSVTGLTGGTLDANGDLVYAKKDGYNSSTKVPFFDGQWLAEQKVGSVVDTQFPMRTVEDEYQIKTYYFDSTDGKDNVWFSGLKTDSPTVSYAYNTKKAKDSLYSYSDREASGYGFFPFDERNANSDVDAKDYGFGMRIDVPFNLGYDVDSSGTKHYGQLKGVHKTNGSVKYEDQIFKFTGDDDLWVYIDGVLVLDLGGAHKEAEGVINFNNGKGKGKVSLKYGTENKNGATRNTEFSIVNYDPTVQHTLTMFYVERGMVESNLSFNFNFAPITNQFLVDKTVAVADVNEGLQDVVKAADTFTFAQAEANEKEYTHKLATGVSSKETVAGGQYTLKNNEAADFNDQFTVGEDFSVEESYTSQLSYSTSWKAIDLELKRKGKTEQEYTIGQNDDSTKAEFKFKTLDNSSEFAMTRIQLSYTNTPDVTTVLISKEVQGLADGETDDTDFGGTVYVSLDNGTTWGTYKLKYTINGEDGDYELTEGGKLANNAKLRDGRTLVFEGIPVNAKVKFVEDATDAEHRFVSVTGEEGGTNNGIKVESDGVNEIQVVNEKLKPGEINVTLEAHKTLNGAELTDDAFEFELYDMEEQLLQTKTCNASGSVTFDPITYSDEAFDAFIIKEKVPETPDSDIKTYSEKVYRAEVEVTKAGIVLTPTVTYYDLTPDQPVPEATEATEATDTTDTTDTSMPILDDDQPVVDKSEFVNEVKPGEVYIVKEDTAGLDVKGVTFGIYKVDEQGQSLEGLSAFKTASTDTMQVPYSDGSVKTKTAVHFEDLPLYADNKYYADKTKKAYQWYAIAEIDPTSNFYKNNTVYYFQLPVSGSYSPKFDYVNGHILSPESGLDGLFGYKMLGVYAIAFGSLMGLAYLFYTKRVSKKARYSAKHGVK